MSGCLLDTNVALIALASPSKLSRSIKAALLAGPNTVSVVSYWEVLIKSMKGTLQIGDPTAWWRDTLDQLDATPLVLRPSHVDEIRSLPPIHQDPFDRILIAQSIAEELKFITTDREIAGYASARLKVIS